MSPSIQEMFGVDETAGDAGAGPFSLDDFMAEADKMIGQHAEATASEADAQSALSEPSKGENGPDESPGIEGASTESQEPEASQDADPQAPAQGTPAGEPSLPPPVPPDPLASLSPSRREALLALDQAITADPARAARVWAAVGGDAPAVAGPPPPPTAPPAPTMPEYIEPDSIEAQLWQIGENQRQMKADLDAQRAQQAHQQALSTHATIANEAGNQAAATFHARYPSLTMDDLANIARQAGQTGLAAGLVQAMSGGKEANKETMLSAYDRALEHVLWSTPEMRTKVIGEQTVATTASPAAPNSGETKRKLTALSGAASPVSQPTQRPKLESTTDGRMTGESRNRMIKELASNIARSNSGGM